jgi:hypothetical protein
MTGAVFHVVWTPGTDDLLGICHCGAEHLGQDPVDVWSWLLAHPDGHQPAAGPAGPPPDGDQRAEPPPAPHVPVGAGAGR